MKRDGDRGAGARQGCFVSFLVTVLRGVVSGTSGVVGRDRELATVTSFLDALPSGTSGLLLEGAAGMATPVAGAGLPAGRLTRIQVGPLTVAAFEAALRASAGAWLSRLTVRRLFDASGGNPFYGLELARALDRVGDEPSSGEPLPVPADLHGVLSARLAVLPEVRRSTTRAGNTNK